MVLRTPCFSQRRPEVMTRSRRQSGRLRRLRRLHSSMSSISEIAAKPPAAWNASRRAKIAWSPVATPVSRERRFITPAMTRSSGDRPSISTSKRPQTRRDRSRPLSTTWSASAGSRVSTWRKSSTSPDAFSAPAFICGPRPGCAAMTRSARSRARGMVASRLPPSTTITSVPSERRIESASRAAAMPSPSLRTGMMIESFDMMRSRPDCVHVFGRRRHDELAADVGQPRRPATGRGRSDAGRIALSLGRLSERAAATRPLAGGASVAVAGNPDRLARDLGVEQVREVRPLAPIVFERQIQHLVEIAIVDIAPPIDGDEISAHHVLEIGVEMSVAQQIDVAIELSLGDKDRAEPLDGHVCKRIEPIELDAVTLAEHALVIGFQRLLRRRQRWPLRIIDKIEHKPGFGPAIAQLVEALQAAQRTFEHPLATLAIHVVLEIARHGCGDLDLLAGEELGEVLLSGHFKDRQIAAIHHLHVHLARRAHQLAKVLVEFRRAAGDVERR